MHLEGVCAWNSETIFSKVARRAGMLWAMSVNGTVHVESLVCGDDVGSRRLDFFSLYFTDSLRLSVDCSTIVNEKMVELFYI